MAWVAAGLQAMELLEAIDCTNPGLKLTLRGKFADKPFQKTFQANLLRSPETLPYEIAFATVAVDFEGIDATLDGKFLFTIEAPC